MKSRSFVWLVVLAVGLLGGAALAVQTPQPSDGLQGIEISPGIVIGDVRYGTTFIGTANGPLPGTWSVMFRYSPPHPGGNVTNYIQGGSFSLNVYKGFTFKGTIQGSIVAEGSYAQWDSAGEMAYAQVNLAILGGTGTYKGASGSGQFLGLLSHQTLIPTMSGTLTLAVTP